MTGFSICSLLCAREVYTIKSNLSWMCKGNLTFPVLFFFLFSPVWISIVRYGKKDNKMCNLQYDLARFIPLESKVPTASHQVVTGGPPPPPPPQKKKRNALPCFSNLSHHATASLHVKFDSKVVACCRRTPRTCNEGGERRSLSNDTWQNKLQCFVPQFMVTLQRHPQCAIPSSQGKAPWGQGW